MLEQDINTENFISLGGILKDLRLGIVRATKNVDFYTIIMPFAKSILEDVKMELQHAELCNRISSFMGTYADAFVKVNVLSVLHKKIFFLDSTYLII